MLRDRHLTPVRVATCIAQNACAAARRLLERLADRLLVALSRH